MKKILFSIGIAFLFLWLIGLIIGVEFPEIVGIENNIEKGAYFLNITLVALLDILLLILGKKN